MGWGWGRVREWRGGRGGEARGAVGTGGEGRGVDGRGR